MFLEVRRKILITGASGAIGGALALEYASSGTELILHGRDLEQLNNVACRCRDRGATVHVELFDLRDLDYLRRRLLALDALYSFDLVIANAGINISMRADGRGEDWEAIHELIEVNVLAVMATFQTMLPGMRARGGGQIALISSLAAWRGLPDTPSYSASKAAIKAYGEAMRDAVASDGVKVNVVMPGYVRSQMAYDMPGPKPFMWDAPRAARRIRKGLDSNNARISFPFPLNLGCWLLAGIHPAVSGWILKRLHYNE